MSRIIGGVLTDLSDANTALVDLSGEGEETIEVYRTSQYAIYSRPLPKTKVVVLSDRAGDFIISQERSGSQATVAQIPTLQEGDFAIDTGNVKMHFKHASKEIEISGAVNINLGEGARVLINEAIVDYMDSHTHPFPGGVTGLPSVLAKTVKESFTTKIVKGG